MTYIGPYGFNKDKIYVLTFKNVSYCQNDKNAADKIKMMKYKNCK